MTNTIVLATPEGAEWATADDPEGCSSCHFDSAVRADSPVLRIDGLPKQPEAGNSYLLTLALDDPSLLNSGFLLTVSANGNDAGQLAARDEGVETKGAQARSTLAGSKPTAPGEARWSVVWTAPAELPGPLRFDLWANAGNEDLSPLGDKVHHRVLETALTP